MQVFFNSLRRNPENSRLTTSAAVYTIRSMKRNPILDQVQALYGSQRALADALQVDPMAVYRWHTKGVPPERALQIEILTNGMVTRQDLRPDLFGLTALQH